MPVRPRAAVALLASLLILALPASASAANFVVNSTADEADAIPGGVCETAGGKCTLRAAIEVTDLTLAEKDRIEFSNTVFKGTLGSTIEPSTALPAITVPLEIAGGDCFGEDGPDAPCAGIKGPSGAAALTIENANGVTIEGLSITGAQFGIDVVSSSEDFIARNDWIGLNLNAAKEGNLTGIFLDPGSDGATIGGPAASERNVISGNEGDGLDLNGASEAAILGNYFGVSPPGPVGLPGGSAQIANGKDIEITDSTASGGVKAENNVVGAKIEGAALTTPACDGGCNVISGASGAGIDLNGNGSGQNEAAASGPTAVYGNYVGLSADGTEVVADATFDVLAGAADSLTVGEPEGGANLIAGGSYGVYGENGDDLLVRGNKIGFGATGGELSSPTGAGVFAYALSVTSNEAGATIEGNNIRMDSGAGIEHRFVGARIAYNSIEGGANGIITLGNGNGSLIENNHIFSASEVGIELQNDSNVVVGNEVVTSGGAGIEVQAFDNGFGFPLVTGNRIGGDLTSEEENILLGNSGSAIRISDIEESENEIARNRGNGNGGLFIDLVPSELGEKGPNNGIEPPVIAAASQSKASGTALPGAKVRVFRKAKADAGELESFLSEAVADGSGNWKVAYGSIPAGTIVAATQTNEAGGTSELATASAVADPSNGGGGGNGGGNGGNKDAIPPDTKIVKGPPKKTHKTTVKFKFTSTEAGSTFECKLDRKPFKKCSSPKTYKKLKAGKHVFKVRAIDRAGNVDPTPAKRKFQVLA